jgi:hypothetical protein
MEIPRTRADPSKEVDTLRELQKRCSTERSDYVTTSPIDWHRDSVCHLRNRSACLHMKDEGFQAFWYFEGPDGLMVAFGHSRTTNGGTSSEPLSPRLPNFLKSFVVTDTGHSAHSGGRDSCFDSTRPRPRNADQSLNSSGRGRDA